ncbi:MAG TPA: Mu-like prophage major head subunit gpT family protein, partial [Planctomycetota bacterium]|nr:Mu-like prophage major head subunit gpT family protein [Planctomycetota bacterium]
VHKSILKEISFVDSGADAKTSVKVAATSSRKEPNMEFSNWLKAQGIDESKLTADERARLEAQFAEMKENGENIVQPPQPTSAPSPAASPAPVPQPVVQAGAPDPIKELRAREAAEIRRVAAIRKHTNGKFSEIEAKAIEEGWTPDKAGYEVLLAARPQAPAIQTGHTAQVANLPKVLECALMMGRAGIAETDLKARFAIEVLDAAYKYRTASFKSIVNMICRFEGRPAPEIHDLPKQWVDAAFSTNTVAYILLNTANKVLLDGYNAIETIARTICKRLSAVDFKTTYAARLTGDYAFQKVGPDGELKHAVIKDQGYAVKVDTYGRLIGLTRQDVINDDLGAFTDLPRQIGRAAALKVEDVFFTLVLANTGSFFASGNTNYDSGASSVIGVAGLNRAVALFRKQTDEDGHPIMISPKFLVVPPELEATARQLYASINLIAVGVPTTAEKTAAAANPHSGKYAPLVSPYLSNTAYTGNSATAWYLFGDPNDLAAFALSYLNGQDTPVIEQADPDPKYLGTIWRGYMDFGVAQLDPRGATKSAGA